MAYKSGSASNPANATEFCYPDPSVKSKPSSDVSFAQSKAASGGLDPVKGPGIDNFTPVSSAPNSPIKGDGFGDKDYPGPGGKGRSSVSYG